ncbi:MAG: MBL fold metallo-hydrolase [Bacteroidales bacterium]|nr:MBL fold metallo-hydrolase [Bacteroidales bacterium]
MSCKITFMGTGTSQGVPIIGCDCEVCTSADPRDKRLRASVLFESEGYRILVDAGPDFRYQMLRASVRHLDAILLTHNHKDHTGGLDDVRAFNWIEKKAVPIYCEKYVQDSLRMEYSYVFSEDKYPGIPEFDLHTIDENVFYVGPVKIIPIRAYHYRLPVLGFRIGDISYVTDANYIPEEEFEKLKGSKVFIINTVRIGHHVSHFSLQEALDVIKRVGAPRSYLTHLSHQLPKHSKLLSLLPEGVFPAQDMLSIEV